MHCKVFYRFGYAIVYIVAITFIPFGHAYQLKPRDIQSDIARNFSAAIAQIVENYFFKTRSKTGFNLQLKAKCKKNRKFLGEVVDGTIELIGDNIGVTLSNGEPIADNDEMHYCILLVDSLESLRFLYLNIAKYDLHIDGSFFIVLHSVCSPSHYYNNLAGILDLSWSAGISHVDILIYAVRNVILLFHGMPFTTFHCGVNVPEIHNKFIDGQWQHGNFYASKASNMYGCPLVCATWVDMPYLNFSPYPTRGMPIYDGIEGQLLEYLADRMNFTITMRWMTADEINQTIYNEREFFKRLFQSGVDFAIGSFHYKATTRDDSYAPTVPYYLSTYYFVVSSQTDPYRPLEKLLLPFTVDIWYALIVCNIIGNVVINLASRLDNKWKSLILGRQNHSPHYNLFVVLFGGSVSNDPIVPFSRFLLAVWTLSTIVLRTVYQGLLFHIIKHNLQMRPPQGIDDLKFNYKVYMTETVFSYLQHLHWLSARAYILNSTELDSFEILKSSDVNPYEKPAILSAYEYFGYHTQNHLDMGSFHLVPETLFTQQLSIYMKKNSMFFNRFNSYISSYINDGFMDQMDRILIDSNKIYKRYDEEHNKPMGLTELWGAFHLLTMGLFASLCIFAGELAIAGLKIYCKSTAGTWRNLSNLTKKRRPKSKRFEFIE